jgi:RNA polymerase sigma factor (sigma-70 family)
MSPVTLGHTRVPAREKPCAARAGSGGEIYDILPSIEGVRNVTGEPRASDAVRLDPAIEAALIEHRRDFLRMLTQRVGNTETAEEVLQQFYRRAVSRAFALRRRESILAWLSRLLSTVLADYARREATRRRQETAYAQHQALTQEAPELESTVCTCLYALLPTLKPEYADILRRADLLGEPSQQVAAALGVTVQNVAVRLHRARQALKRALLLWCTTCPEHGFLRCACALPLRTPGAAEHEQSQPP